jgi:hypothetical protein
VWMRRVKSSVGIVVRVPGVWMACTWEIMSARARVEIDSQSVSCTKRATTAILVGSSVDSGISIGARDLG